MRPLLSSLLVVLGLQLFALGLLGELIIFTHAKHLRDYQIDSVVRFGSAPTLPVDRPQSPAIKHAVVQETKSTS